MASAEAPRLADGRFPSGRHPAVLSSLEIIHELISQAQKPTRKKASRPRATEAPRAPPRIPRAPPTISPGRGISCEFHRKSADPHRPQSPPTGPTQSPQDRRAAGPTPPPPQVPEPEEAARSWWLARPGPLYYLAALVCPTSSSQLYPLRLRHTEATCTMHTGVLGPASQQSTLWPSSSKQGFCTLCTLRASGPASHDLNWHRGGRLSRLRVLPGLPHHAY